MNKSFPIIKLPATSCNCYERWLFAGLSSALFNSKMATTKLIYAPVLMPNEVYAFSVFAITSIFIWMILAATAAVLAEKL